jgi:two-component system response regulator AtoC
LTAGDTHLEDGHYRRVGSVEDARADVRVIAATNKDLEAEQKAGRLREDLFFRLNVIAIPLPLLKERKEDIPELVAHFLKTRPLGPQPHTISGEALAALKRYDWPGNVRELANVLERAQILAEAHTITPDDLPDPIRVPGSAAADEPDNPFNLDMVEKKLVREALQQTHGNKLAAARILGISPRTLYRMIERYDIANREP